MTVVRPHAAALLTSAALFGGAALLPSLVAAPARATPAPSPTWGTASAAGSPSSNEASTVALNAQGTRGLVMWIDNNAAVHSRIAVISGTTITWGDDTILAGSQANTLSMGFSADGTTAIAAWRINGQNTDVEYSIATIDDSVAHWSPSAGTLPTKYGIPLVAISADGGRLAVGYGTDTSPYPFLVQAGSVSGGAVTWSTAATVSGADVVGGAQRLAMSADGRTIVATYGKNPGSVLRATAMTVTGTSPPVISLGSTVDVSQGALSSVYAHGMGLSGNGGRMVAAWGQTSGVVTLRARVGVITGNAISFSDVSNLGTSTYDAPLVTLDDTGDRLLLGWMGQGTGITATTAAVDDSLPTWDDTVSLPANANGGLMGLALSTDGSHAAVLAGNGYAPNAATLVYAASLSGGNATWNAGDTVAPLGGLQAAGGIALSSSGTTALASWRLLTGSPQAIKAVAGTFISPAPTITQIDPDTGPAAGGTSVTVSGAGFISGATVTIGGSMCAVSSVAATSITCSTPPGTTGPADVVVTNPDQQAATVIGGFTYSAPPAPPAPVRPSAPRDVTAAAGDGEAVVSWQPPADPGTFAVSTYQVTSTPGGASCLTSTTSCRIVGLANGTSYMFTARALSGAGWSVDSAPSNAVTPQRDPAPGPVTIVISGTRSARSVDIAGITTGMGMGGTVVPWAKKTGQPYQRGRDLLVDAQGRFTWSRKISGDATLSVYVTAGDVRSNFVILRGR